MAKKTPNLYVFIIGLYIHLCTHTHLHVSLYISVCIYDAVHIHTACIDMQHSAQHTLISHHFLLPKSRLNTGGHIIASIKMTIIFYCRIILTVRCTAICVIHYYCPLPAATGTGTLLERLREEMLGFMRELETGPRVKYNINSKAGLTCVFKWVCPLLHDHRHIWRGWSPLFLCQRPMS